MPTIASGFRLANNVKIPCIGLGTWQVPDDEKLIEHIHDAINIGYRHIDTAFIYGNEAGVGEAIRTCGVPRTDLRHNQALERRPRVRRRHARL